MSEERQSSLRPAALAVLVALLLTTAAIYARGMDGEFQFDDAHSIRERRDIRHLDGFLSSATISDAVHGKRVLTNFTFALSYRMAGLAPRSFHAVNLAIHLVATLLVFLFTRRILALGGVTGLDALALVVAGAFALHPLQTQAVIYLSQRAESLASALYLGSLLLLLRAEQRGVSAAGVGLYLAGLLAFALGLNAKVIVATLPVAYLLMGILPGSCGALASTPRRIALAAPFLAYSALTAALALSDMKAEDAGFSVPSMPPARYFPTQWHVLVTYLRLLFWPAGQHPDWEFPVAHGLGDRAAVLAGLFLLVLLGCASLLYLRHRSRADEAGAAARTAAFGVAWFFLILLPTSSVIPLADVLMEHRVYLASWGVFLAASVLLSVQIRRGRWRVPRGVTAATVICLGAGLAAATFVRVGVWTSRLTLWGDCVAKSPRKARAHLGLGEAYRQAGDVDLAIREFRKALDLARNDPRWIRQEIHGELAAALLASGRADETVAEIHAGLSEKSNDAGLLGILAMAHLRRGDLPAAEAAAQDSVRVALANSLRETPDNELGAGRHPAASLRVLGLVHLARGNQPAATVAFERAVELDPDEAQGRFLLAQAYRAQGRSDRACDLLRGPFDEMEAQVAEARAFCHGP
jgi:Flp pilus assembly protein TadD